MSTFLLLRSNKQTGPYTVEDLRQMGLKPYDLVWVEGKSAAWRYPGEVEELKSFAPAVEEQPFDRFYKKPAQINQPLFNASQAVPSAQSEKMSAAPADRVFYTEEKAPAVKPVYKQQPTPEPAAAVTVKERQPAATVLTFRSTSPEMPSSTTRPGLFPEKEPNYAYPNAPDSRRLPSWKTFIKPFIIGFSLAAFLGVGVIVGIGIGDRRTNSTKDLTQKEDGENSNQQTVFHPKTIPVAVPPSAENNKFSENTAQQAQSGPAENAESLVVEKKKNKIKPKLSDSLNLLKPKPVADSSAIGAMRQIAHATESEQTRKDLVKNKIAELVSLSGNKYSVGTFGGISELQLTISNKSLYPMDLVVVEVQYIQSNKKVFKTENIYFRNVGAGSALMEEAPKSSRGIKVQYKITLINSKELGLSYTGI